MKKIISLICITLFLFGFVGCGSSSSSSDSKETKKTENKQVKNNLTAQSIFNKLKEKEGTNMINILTVDAKHDRDGLFGKQNEYYQKIEWNDNRVEAPDGNNSSIEIFKTAEDAAARKNYLEALNKTIAFLNQYVEQKDNAVLRIDGGLKSEQANEYIKIFKSM